MHKAAYDYHFSSKEVMESKMEGNGGKNKRTAPQDEIAESGILKKWYA